MIYSLVTVSVFLLALIYITYKTVQKIKYKRQKGIDLTNRNLFYKMVSKTFLANLPK